MRYCTIPLIILTVILQARAIEPNIVTFDEMQSKDRWVKAHLFEPVFTDSGSQPSKAPIIPKAGLDVYANNDPVIPNKRGGNSLKIADKTYSRGLYCHAVSKIVVTLPGPGNRFTAEVGLDHNDDTLRGRGSVVFSVSVNDQLAFKSDIMKVTTPACSVDVDLKGATSFVLEIGDAGDGIGWDQSDWAEAGVLLEDGTQLWLGDMEIRDKRHEGRISPIHRSSTLPFAFLYDGEASDALLRTWPGRMETTRLDAKRIRYTRTWKHPNSNLEIRFVAVDYTDFPAIEWTLYFKNIGSGNTPIISNIQALDVSLERAAAGDFALHAWRGDTCSPVLYQPLTETLPPNTNRCFAPTDGRATNHAFPYYKVQMPGGGILLAVGWPGQWSSCFTTDNDRHLRIIAGQELTHLTLRPGEEIRTPLIAILFWKGEDTVRAQNLWRRWMWAYNVPRTKDGKLPPPILFGNTSLEFNEMINANEDNQKYFIDRYIEEKIGIHYWWMDAGWYPCDGHWPNTGTWESDTTRFPNGLRAISDHALARDIKTLVWFEPERVGGGWLSRNHPEWRIGPLLNLGNPQAWNWLVNHVDGQLKSQGIHLYRQDFNMSPLGFWRGNDAPDRQGITENFHVQGYLAYWDQLRKRHPQLIIDSCASGGRRNDLETMRRAIPLHPTDYNYADLIVKQAFHHSLFHWIPYFGSNTVPVNTVDPYTIRSGYALGMVFGYDMRRTDLDYALLRKLADQWRRINECYYGDFYPVLPYSLNEDNWIAWQFHRPDHNEGVIQAFRRQNNNDTTKTLRLGGLDPASQYRFTDFDKEQPFTLSGRTLLDKGLPVEIPLKPGSVVIHYMLIKPK
ncbi:MAG: NPCBM/NEW2 domain-containing protein [Sedimentisphaerales bacterium]|nr:NPCBM/NEW2 domain-containing protein [Sedimentisphaerales bacterium]